MSDSLVSYSLVSDSLVSDSVRVARLRGLPSSRLGEGGLSPLACRAASDVTDVTAVTDLADVT